MHTVGEHKKPAAGPSGRREREVVVKKEKEVFTIPASQILYAESFGRKVVLHLENGQVEYYERIGRLEQKLGSSFFRVHRSFLVNLQKIEDYTRSEVKIRGGGSAWISKYKYADFVRHVAVREAV